MNHEIKLEKYLPTIAELEQMDQDTFIQWIEEAPSVIAKREVERDPLTHLKKRVSQIIESEIPEEEKERRVHRLLVEFAKSSQLSNFNQ